MIPILILYGALGGVIVAGFMLSGLFFGPDEMGESGSEVYGYLSMLVALSVIFLAVKHHRDRNLGGVIKFWPAAGLGLAIAGVASLFYVAAWEIVFSFTGEEFMQTYLSSQSARYQAELDAEEAARKIAELQEMMALYGHWWFRMPITLTEILPVGVIITLISAGILRNPAILPARRG